MIKTIIATTIDKLDEQVNEFMKRLKQNLPVRTEVFVVGTEPVVIYHKATIFYNDDFRDKQYESDMAGYDEHLEKDFPDGYDTGIIEEETVEPESSNDKGALWWQKDGTLSGKYNGKPIALSDKDLKMIEEKGKGKTHILEKEVYIMPNKYKKGPKHPDFVILPPRKY